MRLQLRLSLLVSALIIIVSTSIGSFAVSTAYNQQVTTYDAKISESIAQLRATSEDPLSYATFLVDQSDFKFSLALVTDEGELVVIEEGASAILDSISRKQLRQAVTQPVNIQGTRFRAVALPDGEYLILGYSIKDAQNNRNQNYLYLGGFTSLVLALAIALSFLLFRTDAQLSRAANALQENQARMREFLGDAAHELRTPLTIIRGYFELSRKENIDEEKRQYHQARIEGEIGRMQRLIDDLLIVAELDSSKPESQGLVDFSIALTEQLQDLAALQPERPIKSEIDPGVMVRIDEESLARLLGNIFTNLKRYTPAESEVQVRLRKVGSEIEFEVADSGPGLPATFYERGIRAFTRFDASRSRDSGGSGLGMAIIEKVVTRANGKLHLTPSTNGGLSIRVGFPDHD